MLVIGLTGKGGSGKGTVAEYLEKNFGAKSYRFSKALDDILKRIYQSNNRTNQANLALALRNLYGNDILSKILKNDIKKDNPGIAVVDGIRYHEEVTLLKTLPSFKLLAIQTDKATRYQRIIKRGEKAGEMNLTEDELNLEESLKTESYISEMIKQADKVINNNGNLDNLHQQIDKIMREWKSV